MREQRNEGTWHKRKNRSKLQKKELNKMEISNLSGTEFKTLVMRVLKELIRCFNSIKKIQSEI